MSATITKQVILDTEDCYSCGVTFAMPRSFKEQRQRDGKNFYCPAGHGQHYTETEADRLRKELERTKRNLEWAESRTRAARDQAEAAERSKAALKGVITKQRKRAAAGVCPCCHRTFQQLARHMANKHPGYAETPIEDGAA